MGTSRVHLAMPPNLISFTHWSERHRGRERKAEEARPARRGISTGRVQPELRLCSNGAAG